MRSERVRAPDQAGFRLQRFPYLALPVIAARFRHPSAVGDECRGRKARPISALLRFRAALSARDLLDVEGELIPGLELVLRREPDNDHDDLAIRVQHAGVHLGYIPRSSNEVLARLMDAGKQLAARLVSKERRGEWLRLEIEILLREL